jgi:hypothetical protein
MSIGLLIPLKIYTLTFHLIPIKILKWLPSNNNLTVNLSTYRYSICPVITNSEPAFPYCNVVAELFHKWKGLKLGTLHCAIRVVEVVHIIGGKLLLLRPETTKRFKNISRAGLWSRIYVIIWCNDCMNIKCRNVESEVWSCWRAAWGRNAITSYELGCPRPESFYRLVEKYERSSL